jgi:hypothetical protein
MGIVEGQKIEGNGLGCEGSGIVRKVGPDTDLEVGDRVIVFASGSFSTTLVTTSKLCVKMADDLDFVEAASMPCVYCTVIHSLLDIARLEKDQVISPQSTIVPRVIAKFKSDGPHTFCLWWRWNCSHTDMSDNWCQSRIEMQIIGI